MGPISSSSSPKLRRISNYIKTFLSLSLLGLCTSEALVPSSTSFLPHALQTRGGSTLGKERQQHKYAGCNTAASAIQGPRSPTPVNGMGDYNNRNHHNEGANGSTGGGTSGGGGGGGDVNGASPIYKVKNGVDSSSAAAAAAATSTVVAEKSNGHLKDSSFDDFPVPARFIAETNLPTDVGEFRLRAYRTAKGSNEYTGREPSVIYSSAHPPFAENGSLRQDFPLRVHDQCLTSEVFGSQRCDCKQQFTMALKYVADNGGAIIYLQQEGRGIGLANKVAAYALQDVGFDTVDANLHLGLPEDCRQYGAIPSILSDLNIGSIRLMTNNPRKVNRLTELGVAVTGTIPMVVPEANPHNYRYLQAKKDRMDHKNLSPLFRNGNMLPKRAISLAEKYVVTQSGEEMAAKAVHISLSEDGVTVNETANTTEENTQLGVVANEDGYCFGRQSVEDAIDAIRDGKMVVVVDDMNRENEGDLIMAADACTPEDMATIVRYSSGVICIGMEGQRMDELKLPAMVTSNEDPKGTAFSVSVDATKAHGITTGISATDRSKTVNLLADENMKSIDFVRPGHIFPLRAREGGVLTRDGHTEAAVDLSKLAGRSPSGILCEIVSEENPIEMARLPELKRFCKKHGYVLTSIVDIAQYRRELMMKHESEETDEDNSTTKEILGFE